jgi:malonyl-CoA/methylmalonyl-CoA synthetase
VSPGDRQCALRSSAEHLPAGSTPAAVGVGPQESLCRTWRSHWASHPTRDVLIDPVGGRVMSAAEVEERTALAAGRLAAAGVLAGDRVLISAGSSLDLAIAQVAVLRLGAVVMPFNPAYTEAELGGPLAHAPAALALVDDDRRGRIIGRLQPGLAVAPISLDGLPGADRNVRLDEAGPSDTALFIHTSGTTGQPKGVPLSHANLLSSARSLCLAWRWEPDDRLALAVPLFHMHGVGVGLYGTFTAGASAVVLPRFEPESVFGAIGDGASMFFGVPTMWHRLAAHPGAGALSKLRLGVSGSAPLAPALHSLLQSIAGVPPLERYGMSETAMLVSNPYVGERRAGSVGFPLPGVEVRLAADGAAAGEIEVRGQNVFAGYYHRPQATADAFSDGWFRTGDVGSVDPDGYLRIVGRTKELIISGGYNVFPREIEEVLSAHPAVSDAAVIGLPDAEWGEMVCALVVTEAEVSDRELEAWVSQRLAGYKRPRRWERVEEIPRNALGKLIRHQLSERFAAPDGQDRD